MCEDNIRKAVNTSLAALALMSNAMIEEPYDTDNIDFLHQRELYEREDY